MSLFRSEAIFVQTALLQNKTIIPPLETQKSPQISSVVGNSLAVLMEQAVDFLPGKEVLRFDAVASKDALEHIREIAADPL